MGVVVFDIGGRTISVGGPADSMVSQIKEMDEIGAINLVLAGKYEISGFEAEKEWLSAEIDNLILGERRSVLLRGFWVQPSYSKGKYYLTYKHPWVESRKKGRRKVSVLIEDGESFEHLEKELMCLIPLLPEEGKDVLDFETFSVAMKYILEPMLKFPDYVTKRIGR